METKRDCIAIIAVFLVIAVLFSLSAPMKFPASGMASGMQGFIPDIRDSLLENRSNLLLSFFALMPVFGTVIAVFRKPPLLVVIPLIAVVIILAAFFLAL